MAKTEDQYSYNCLYLKTRSHNRIEQVLQMQILILLPIVAIILAILAAIVYKDRIEKGDDPSTAFLWALLAFFAIGLIIYLFVVILSPVKQCPKCKKPVPQDAKVCPYCRQNIEQEQT